MQNNREGCFLLMVAWYLAITDQTTNQFYRLQLWRNMIFVLSLLRQKRTNERRPEIENIRAASISLLHLEKVAESRMRLFSGGFPDLAFVRPHPVPLQGRGGWNDQPGGQFQLQMIGTISLYQVIVLSVITPHPARHSCAGRNLN